MSYNGTNYHFTLTTKEKEILEELHKSHKDKVLIKQKESLSAFIRHVIKNTYEYIINLPFEYEETINSLYNKKQYNALDFNFINDMKKSNNKNFK